MENLDYKNENIERKHLKNIKQPVFKGKIQSFRIRKRFEKKLKEKIERIVRGDLKDGEEKIKREIQNLFHKPIAVSKNDLHKFEEQEMMKIRPIIRNWFDR